MVKFLKYLLQLVVSPGEGWKDIALSAGNDSRRLAFAGLFPWLLIVGISSFVPLLYGNSGSVLDCLLAGMVNFGKYALGYFTAPLIMSLFIDSAAGTDVDDDRLHILTACATGLLGAIALLENCMPVRMTILHFLPFFVGIVIWKGTDYLRIPASHVGAFMILALSAILVPPYLIGWLLGLIL